MKESPHITLTAEQDKRETVICIVWAVVVVLGMLALLLHGLAFFSWTEPTMEEIYTMRRMDNSIKAMEGQIEDLYFWRTAIIEDCGWDRLEYENHKHQFWTGKIKKEVIK